LDSSAWSNALVQAMCDLMATVYHKGKVAKESLIIQMKKFFKLIPERGVESTDLIE
jgi:hypothetical protein